MSPRLGIKAFFLSVIVFLGPVNPFLSDPSLRMNLEMATN